MVGEVGRSVKNASEAVALYEHILSDQAKSVSGVGTAKPFMSGALIASDRFARESRRSDFDHLSRYVFPAGDFS